MKWQNIFYVEIARELGVSYDTVKSWFRKGGFLVKAYKEYSDDQKIIWKLQEKQQLINTLNGNNPQQTATFWPKKLKICSHQLTLTNTKKGKV